MSDQYSSTEHPAEEEKTMMQEVLYWLVVYLITIPVSFVLVGLIVRVVLALNSSY